MHLMTRRFWDFLGSNIGVRFMLAAFYLIGGVVTFFITAENTFGPIHFNDEVRYWNMASSLFARSFDVVTYHHSPPIYAVALLPAWVLFPPGNIYMAIKVLNILYSTSVVFPVYLLIRQFAGRQVSLMGAVLTLLLPAQVVMPRLVMSENLFYPLFLWAVYLAFTNVLPAGHRWKFFESVGFGALCGVLILTRYLALPLVPMLFLIWWMKPLEDERLPFLISKKKVLYAAGVFLPFMLVVTAWVLFGMHAGVPLYRMIGFGVANNPNPAQLERSRFVMWASFYLSYMILMVAPYLNVLVAGVFHLRTRDWKNVTNRWLVSITLITIAFLLAATRHSWRARYNYPEPETIQGRYIFYLAPLFLIALFAVLQKARLPRLPASEFWLILLIVSELTIAAYWNIFHGLIFLDRPMRFSMNSPDGYLFQSLGVVYIASAILLLFITTPLVRYRRVLIIIFPLVLAAILLWGDVLLYQRILKPLQQQNFPMAQTIRVMESRYGTDERMFSQHVIVSIPYEINGDYCRTWRSTLVFYGFENVECELGHGSDRNNPVLFALRIGDDVFTAKSIPGIQYNATRPNQFAYRDAYYLISYSTPQ